MFGFVRRASVHIASVIKILKMVFLSKLENQISMIVKKL